MTFTNEQAKLYDELLRARDEVAFAYWKRQTAKLGEDGDAARELSNARTHFTNTLTLYTDSIRNEHRNP